MMASGMSCSDKALMEVKVNNNKEKDADGGEMMIPRSIGGGIYKVQKWGMVGIPIQPEEVAGMAMWPWDSMQQTIRPSGMKDKVKRDDSIAAAMGLAMLCGARDK